MMLLPGERPGDQEAIAAVAALVAGACGLEVRDLVSRPARGTRAVMRARQVVMYLAVVALQFRPGPVGRFFLRDRTTVTHGLAVIEEARDDPGFDAWLDGLETEARYLLPKETIRHEDRHPRPQRVPGRLGEERPGGP